MLLLLSVASGTKCYGCCFSFSCRFAPCPVRKEADPNYMLASAAQYRGNDFCWEPSQCCSLDQGCVCTCVRVWVYDFMHLWISSSNGWVFEPGSLMKQYLTLHCTLYCDVDALHYLYENMCTNEAGNSLSLHFIPLSINALIWMMTGQEPVYPVWYGHRLNAPVPIWLPLILIHL